MRCSRCGKQQHDGACKFDSSKKSILEEHSETTKLLKQESDSLKKVKETLS